MSATRPADPTAPHVVSFCRTIVPSARPMLMPIRPSETAQPLDCSNNARQLVLAEGGRIQFGWSIWEWPRVYVEAEHHAVYAPPNGAPWIDVTPAIDGETTRVFLPDDAAPYDFENEGIRRENHRLPLVKDERVDQLFNLTRRYNALLNALPGFGKMEAPPHIAVEAEQIVRAKTQAAYAIGMKYTQRNQRCFCGSGDKFKKCHGRSQ